MFPITLYKADSTHKKGGCQPPSFIYICTSSQTIGQEKSYNKTNIYTHDKSADNMLVGDYPCPYHHSDIYRVALEWGRGNRTFIYFFFGLISD